jgi:hypothetical protein
VAGRRAIDHTGHRPFPDKDQILQVLSHQAGNNPNSDTARSNCCRAFQGPYVVPDGSQGAKSVKGDPRSDAGQ